MVDAPGAWPAEPSLDNVIAELEREAHFLELYTYPSQVKRRHLTQDKADYRLRCFAAAVHLLRGLRDGRATTRKEGVR